jgi:cytochrome c biogenesis protein CcmG/thiol:disulfide interchange protein DsbE
VVATLIGACGGGDTSPGKIGQPAPPITGTALDGTPVNLADLKGRPVIVNFWASWCVPCREEFPLFQQKLAELGPTDGLEMIGVLYKDEPEMAQRFLSDFGEAWPTIADPEALLADAYRVVAPPQTYFIDADGILQAIHIGQVDAEDFDTQYAKIKP